MAWNEPGGGKDPWGNRGGDQGPPDLDEVLRKAQGKLRSLFGGGRRGGGGGGTGTGGVGPLGIALLVGVVLVVWVLSGIYIVDASERGVVLRFGKHVDTTVPGIHWHIPYPIETAEIVNVNRIRNVEIGYRTVGGGTDNVRPVTQESLMLTQDENIVDLQIGVQYRVNDAQKYLFNVRNPDVTLGAAAESALREVVGKNDMDFILTQGRAQIATRTRELTQQILDGYDAGLNITEVTMQQSQPPEQVQSAFEDAIKAREDEETKKNRAKGYANEVVQQARGQAARIKEEAQGYKEQRIARASGEADRFSQVQAEYTEAPRVTRKRLYLETMEEILARTTKVTIDVSEGSNLLYMPFDRILNSRSASSSRSGSSGGSSASGESSSSSGGSGDMLRERGNSRAREVR